MQYFTTLNDAIDYVRIALDDFVDDYDVEAIAREVTHWDEEKGKLAITMDDEEFWAVVESNAYDYFVTIGDRDEACSEVYVRRGFHTVSAAYAFFADNKDEVREYGDNAEMWLLEYADDGVETSIDHWCSEDWIDEE